MSRTLLGAPSAPNRFLTRLPATYGLRAAGATASTSASNRSSTSAAGATGSSQCSEPESAPEDPAPRRSVARRIQRGGRNGRGGWRLAAPARPRPFGIGRQKGGRRRGGLQRRHRRRGGVGERPL